MYAPIRANTVRVRKHGQLPDKWVAQIVDYHGNASFIHHRFGLAYRTWELAMDAALRELQYSPYFSWSKRANR